MHRRISVNEVCFPALPLTEKIAWWRKAGIDRVGLASLYRGDDGWPADLQLVQDAGIEVGYLMHARMYHVDTPSSWPASSERLQRSIDAAAAAGVPTVYCTTGPKGSLEFEAAAEALSQAIAGVRQYAQKAGVAILIEASNPLMAHTTFVHRLADVVTVARQAQIGVCFDFHATWTESGLYGSIAEAGPLLGLVQVSDFVPEKFTLGRDPLGDGILPVEKMLRATLETGYSGLIDLELFRRPEDSAYDDTVRSLNWLEDLLDRLGV
jgi:sugar phosphate isomerase/epimerase